MESNSTEDAWSIGKKFVTSTDPAAEVWKKKERTAEPAQVNQEDSSKK